MDAHDGNPPVISLYDDATAEVFVGTTRDALYAVLWVDASPTNTRFAYNPAAGLMFSGGVWRSRREGDPVV